MPGEPVDKRAAAREVIDILDEISTLLVRPRSLPRSTGPQFTLDCPLIIFRPTLLTWSLQNTHLDRQTLSYCVSMIENGVNPEALAVGRSGASYD